MGQTQSTNNQEDLSSNQEGHHKKDYYELLQVEQDASAEEIKKAYRKKALELHPDRNYGNVEATTKLFAEIQSAYEVLSDPQERSWYDSHRNAFLGNDEEAETANYSYNVRMTTSSDILKLFSRFDPRMEFSDSTNGFYGALRETFAQLAAEEQVACRWEGIEAVDYPSFGSSFDDWEVVRQFYGVWGGFSTKKSFSWKDVYRYSEAPDRRVRRLMEKENKRLRDAAIREFNEAVRSLVAFVKKRDPRYKSYKESQERQQEATRQSAAAQATRSRAANQAKLRNHIIQDWAKSENPGEDHIESSEDEMEHFECIVCNKNFKSQNQFQAHERSKKHLKAVKQLCWEMRLEHEKLDLERPLDEKTQKNHSHANYEPTFVPKDEMDSGLEVKHDLPSDPHIESTCENSTGLMETPSLGMDVAGDAPDKEDESDYASRELLEDRLGLKISAYESGEDSTNELSHQLSATKLQTSDQTTSKKIGMAKQRRAKKAQRVVEESDGTKCVSCNASFSSRNKLFSHIRTEHGPPHFARKK